MVSSQLLSKRNTKLCEVTHGQIKMMDFGHVSISAVGNLYQLSPFLQSAIFHYPKVSYYSQFGPIAWDDFKLHELTQNHVPFCNYATLHLCQTICERFS